MSKLRVSVVGCGGIAGVHLASLKKYVDVVELISTVDIRPEAAQAAAENFGARRHALDYQDALKDDTDVVFVCVPTHVHAEIALAALHAGKHLFCEKPLARTQKDAQAIVEAGEKSQTCAAVGFVRRYDEEWLAFRDALLAGKIGKPVVWQDLVSGEGPSLPWFSQDEQGGGPFLDGAIHTLDFGLFTFGPAEWVFTHGRTMKSTSTAVDTGTATIRFKSGDELLLAWSWGLPPGCSGTRVFQFLGPNGIIEWPGGVGAPPLPGSAEEGSAQSRFLINQGADAEQVLFPADALSRAYEREVKDFLAAVRGEGEPRATLKDGCESLRLALAVLESARTRQVVTL